MLKKRGLHVDQIYEKKKRAKSRKKIVLTPMDQRIKFTVTDHIVPLEDNIYNFCFKYNIADQLRELFPDLTNYDIEDRLEKRSVIGENDGVFSERGELVVCFYNMDAATVFIRKLNEYIGDKYRLFEEAENY